MDFITRNHIVPFVGNPIAKISSRVYLTLKLERIIVLAAVSVNAGFS